MFKRRKQTWVEIFESGLLGLSHSCPGKQNDLSNVCHVPDTVHTLTYLFSLQIHEVSIIFPEVLGKGSHP